MDSAEQIFRDFLRRRHLKYTTERRVVLQAAARFDRPFEAEELLLELHESACRISKATIYRTLKHLSEAGLIQQVYFGDAKQAHFDFVGGAGAAHDHLLDLDTGKILAFSNETVIKLRNEIAKKMGFEAVGHRFQIIGKRLSDKDL